MAMPEPFPLEGGRLMEKGLVNPIVLFMYAPSLVLSLSSVHGS